MQLKNSRAWQELFQHSNEIKKQKLTSLFVDNNRFKNFSFEINNILIDFSKQKITTTTLDLFNKLIEEINVKKKIRAMFNKEPINHIENRAAFHVGLRSKNPCNEVRDVLNQMENLVEKLNQNEFFGTTGKLITDVLSIGIGGSDLGPRMVCQALESYKISPVNINFLSNVDGSDLVKTLSKLNQETTIVILNSKSFSTVETIYLGNIVKNWYSNKFKNAANTRRHIFAVTANLKKALDFGIEKNNIFELWDWVGGRYSVWSAVGLPIAISIGMQNFKQFLEGANKVDEHFINSPIHENIPMLMAVIGVWNINFLHNLTLAVNPYLNGLELFPSYLQQLEMESNGKSVNINDKFVDYHTAPVIWGGVGCNNQHAYMQLLHQGTQTIPVDFIASVNISNIESHKFLDDLMFASCIGQSKALMQGTELHQQKDELNDCDETHENNFYNAKKCIGDKPSTTILLHELNPSTLGSLIALYEHKVFVQGLIWDIQSFDQWGVELGKKLINNLLPLLQNDFGNKNLEQEAFLDSSTKGLINFFKKYKKT